MTFSPGNIVSARGREWVVLPESTADFVLVRPIGGAEAEATGILTAVEIVKPAGALPSILRVRVIFSPLACCAKRPVWACALPPDHSAVLPASRSNRVLSARAIADGIASPVWCALAIADGVGIAKTIEAALIAREFATRVKLPALPSSVRRTWWINSTLSCAINSIWRPRWLCLAPLPGWNVNCRPA